jgi:putative ABC transport system ATP-binding protein
MDIQIERGEFVAVMGPSGSGKSTLLHMLGLMTPPSRGQVCIDGVPVANCDAERTRLRRTQIGFVFQRFNLLTVLNAVDNIAISMKVRGLSPDGRIAELLERMDVAHVARRRPSKMSVGEQQRVAVARAMAHRPALLLADEPTGNLDSAGSERLLELLRHTNRDEGQTTVMITHSLEAARYADRVVSMKDGRLCDGEI